jgi:ADP-heptose:LPS heptosyltransferase
VPGSGKEVKRWPLENFIAIAARQAALNRRPVFLLGPSEAELRSRIAHALPEALFPLQDWRIPQALRYDASLTVALACSMALVLTNDCGLAHLAALADPPMVVLFGASNPDRWAPRAERVLILRAASFGRPTTDAIPLAAVAAAMERMMPAPCAMPGERLDDGKIGAAIRLIG